MVGNPDGIQLLTERQKQVLRLIARHMQEKEIARELKISVPTVKDHAAMARRHLRVDTTRKAALMLVEFEGGATIPGVGYASGTVANGTPVGQVSDHGTRFYPQRHLHDHQLQRAGNGLADDGDAGQADTPRRYPVDGAAPEPAPWTAEGPVPHGFRHGLADGGRVHPGPWARFRQWLKDLPAIAWIGLVIGVAAMSLVLAAVFFSLLLGCLEMVHQVSHDFGWRS